MPDEKYITVVLMTEDKSLVLSIGFFGYTYEAIEEYMKKHYIECDKEYAKRWTKMKYA